MKFNFKISQKTKAKKSTKTRYNSDIKQILILYLPQPQSTCYNL